MTTEVKESSQAVIKVLRPLSHRIVTSTTRLLIAVLLPILTLQTAFADSDRAPLFASREPLEVVLKLPLTELRRNKLLEASYEANLSYQDSSGDTIQLPLTVKPRGRSRLEFCRMPPMRFSFKPKQVKNTVFSGQKNLKLVVQCKSPDYFRDYLMLEYFIYQAYALLTDASFGTRLLWINYRDRGGSMAGRREPAFLVEEMSAVADRLDMRRIRRAGFGPHHLDAAHLNLMTLFQFMIGNADWSALIGSRGDNCCHNGKPMAPSDRIDQIKVVPYDFDYSGLVDANYAVVDPSLPIRSVRQRIYRGLCINNGLIPASITRINELQEAFNSLLEEIELRSKTRKKTRLYLDDFFATTHSQRRIQKYIFDVCRRE